MLTGKKVKLVPLEKDDLAKSRSWVNDASMNSRMLRVLPVTQGEQEKWYQKIVDDLTKIVFAIKTLKNEEHIGNTGLYHVDWIHRRAELWILIGARNSWRQGVGSEVVSLMQGYAFKSLNLNKLYLNVGVNNKQAIALYKKLDFLQEGMLKEHYYIDGRYVDIVTMAILRSDYAAQE